MKKIVFAVICCLLLLQNCYALYLINPVDKIKAKNEIKKLSKEIDKNQNNPELFYKRATLYWFLNKHYDAQSDFYSAYNLKSDYYDAYILSMHEYLTRKEYGLAFEVLTDLINKNPNYAEGYYYRAIIYEEFHDYNNVIKDITKFIELKPNDQYGYYIRAYAYQRIGKYALAINDYEKYLKDGKNVDNTVFVQDSLKECYEKINKNNSEEHSLQNRETVPITNHAAQFLYIYKIYLFFVSPEPLTLRNTSSN